VGTVLWPGCVPSSALTAAFRSRPGASSAGAPRSTAGREPGSEVGSGAQLRRHRHAGRGRPRDPGGCSMVGARRRGRPTPPGVGRAEPFAGCGCRRRGPAPVAHGPRSDPGPRRRRAYPRGSPSGTAGPLLAWCLFRGAGRHVTGRVAGWSRAVRRPVLVVRTVADVEPRLEACRHPFSREGRMREPTPTPGLDGYETGVPACWRRGRGARPSPHAGGSAILEVNWERRWLA
jgi:hypothetical protein